MKTVINVVFHITYVIVTAPLLVFGWVLGILVASLVNGFEASWDVTRKGTS